MTREKVENMKKQTFQNYIKYFDFTTLFNELGWDNFNNILALK